jgi:hypothetical protein
MKKIFKKPQKAIPRRRLNDESNGSSKTSAWRRNSTIIGQLTYQDDNGDTGDDISSRTRAHRISRRRKQVMVIVGIGFLASAMLLLLILNITSRVSILASNSQNLSRNINSESYASVLDAYLSENPLQRLRFVFDNAAATRYVQEHHPEVADVRQGDIRGVGESDVSFTLREPIASWQIGDTEYFVDKEGVPFEVNYFVRPEVQIIDESGVEQLGEGAMISHRLLAFTGRLVVAADKFGYKVVKVVIPQNTTRQVEVTLDGLSYVIKFSIDRPAGEQMEDAHVAMGDLGRRGIKAGPLDVRVSGKAFYR